MEPFVSARTTVVGMEGEGFFAKVVRSLPAGVLVLDRTLAVVAENGRAREFLSGGGGSFRGRSVLDLIPHEALHTHIQEVIHHPDTAPREIEVHLEGEGKPGPSVLRIAICPVVESPHVLLVVEDASEHARHEDALVELEKLTAMHQLARSVAHELGNPLSVMHSTLEYVHERLEAQGGEELAEYMETVVDHLNRMDELLRTLSEFRHPRPARSEPVDMTRMLTDLARFVRIEARSRGVEVRLRLAQHAPVCVVDVRRMKQVLLNLVKNALDALPNGGVLEVTSAVGPFNGGDGLLVSVRDSGVGIPRDQLKMVFRPLFSTKPGGMGLGLSFCREVVEEHGGEITLKSRRGNGTTVTITLPLSAASSGGDG